MGREEAIKVLNELIKDFNPGDKKHLALLVAISSIKTSIADDNELLRTLGF